MQIYWIIVVITHEMIFKISRFKIIYFFIHFNSVLVYTIVMKRYVTYPDWVEKFRSPGHTIKKTKQGYGGAADVADKVDLLTLAIHMSCSSFSYVLLRLTSTDSGSYSAPTNDRRITFISWNESLPHSYSGKLPMYSC